MPITTLSLLTHSMGGLVARSACHQAEQAHQSWRERLNHLVFLGTPHGGAPLEALGHWVDQALGSHAVTRPFAAIGLVRSAGIQDLREGRVLADTGSAPAPQGLPLPAGAACFTVAASMAAGPQPGKKGVTMRLANQYVGDGLVPLQSALGLTADASPGLRFLTDRQRVLWQTGHRALLHSVEAAAQLRHWLQ